ncbi:MAG: M48 family metallopeptidase [Prevotellaceae bacterium]|jgi:predicted metal-dependent hydrolase|nr:M48 family metallopeptidase [Prevotellaceae bacterium]
MKVQGHVINHPVVGEVYFRKTPHTRIVRIRLRPNRSILVTLPLYTSYAEAEFFFNEKIDWVVRSRARIQAVSEARRTLFTPETVFRTHLRTLCLRPEKRKNLRVQMTDDTVFIYYPVSIPPENERLQATIRQAIEHALLVEAHEVLPARTFQLADKNGLPFQQLMIKRTVSYWGVCASSNAITLNIHLMRLPIHLIDYVILHELCHTQHKNHGPGFWELLNSLTDGHAKEYAKEMKKYSTREY